MNKEQAIKLFEGLIKDSEQIRKALGLGDTGYYTSGASISAYNLAISVLKVMDMEEEPKQDKPVVKPFVAEWYRANKSNLESNIAAAFRRIGSDKYYTKGSIYEWLNDSSNEPIQTLLKMKNGYNVEQPKRWVVKYIPPFIDDFRYYSMDDEIFDITESSWTSDKEDAYPFPEKEKAEAVALLVDGSVEEV